MQTPSEAAAIVPEVEVEDDSDDDSGDEGAGEKRDRQWDNKDDMQLSALKPQRLDMGSE